MRTSCTAVRDVPPSTHHFFLCRMQISVRLMYRTDLMNFLVLTLEFSPRAFKTLSIEKGQKLKGSKGTLF